MTGTERPDPVAICALFGLRCANAVACGSRDGYVLPFAAGRRRFGNGHQIPVKGARFPERIATIVKLQGATILNALT
jgi:hypothetical protein